MEKVEWKFSLPTNIQMANAGRFKTSVDPDSEAGSVVHIYAQAFAALKERLEAAELNAKQAHIDNYDEIVDLKADNRALKKNLESSFAGIGKSRVDEISELKEEIISLKGQNAIIDLSKPKVSHLEVKELRKQVDDLDTQLRAEKYTQGMVEQAQKERDGLKTDLLLVTQDRDRLADDFNFAHEGKRKAEDRIVELENKMKEIDPNKTRAAVERRLANATIDMIVGGKQATNLDVLLDKIGKVIKEFGAFR